MAGNVGRRGAVRKSGSKKGAVVGSGGQRRKGLVGRGKTPKAEERVYHKAYKSKTKPKYNKSRKHEKNYEFVLGRNPVLEGLSVNIPSLALFVQQKIDADSRIEEIIRIAGKRSIPILEISKNELDLKTSNMLHQGVALQIPGYKYTDIEDFYIKSSTNLNPIYVALDNMTDPRNLGAIIRSAAAFGAHGVIIPLNRSVGVTAVSWRTSAGALAKIPVARVTNLTKTVQDFAKNNFQIIGLDAKSEMSVYDYTVNTPILLIIGSEGKGISRLVAENTDQFLSIPMPGGFESLNASVAAGIVLSELTRKS